MTGVFLDPRFTANQRRWGGRLEVALWLVSGLLLATLIGWCF